MQSEDQREKVMKKNNFREMWNTMKHANGNMHNGSTRGKERSRKAILKRWMEMSKFDGKH